KQSSVLCSALDCFVASLLAMTARLAQPALSPLAGESWRGGEPQALTLWLRPSLTLPRKGGGNVKSYTAGFGSPAIAHAARSVFTSRHATVIWPTPPGTGVIAPATFNASANATSPTSRVLPSVPGSRLIPTSITVAPGLI